MKAIRFKFSAPKGLSAIQWMAETCPSIDLHTLLKACYFADKKHLNAYDRPVFGAVYRAMKFGPVPLEIYEMIKGESLWLAELGRLEFPWTLQGYHILPRESSPPPDMSVFSETDIEALTYGLEESRKLNFTDRTAATHGPDWQKANMGIMKYEDMIEESNKKASIVEYLRESARFIRL